MDILLNTTLKNNETTYLALSKTELSQLEKVLDFYILSTTTCKPPLSPTYMFACEAALTIVASKGEV